MLGWICEYLPDFGALARCFAVEAFPGVQFRPHIGLGVRRDRLSGQGGLVERTKAGGIRLGYFHGNFYSGLRSPVD